MKRNLAWIASAMISTAGLSRRAGLAGALGSRGFPRGAAVGPGCRCVWTNQEVKRLNDNPFFLWNGASYLADVEKIEQDCANGGQGTNPPSSTRRPLVFPGRRAFRLVS